MFIDKNNAHLQTLHNERERQKIDTQQLRKVIELSINKKIEQGKYSAVVSTDYFHQEAVTTVIKELHDCGYEIARDSSRIRIKW